MNRRRILVVALMLCVAVTMLCTVTDIHARVIPSKTVQDAVIQYVTEAESGENIEVEVTVPRAFDVEIESDGETELHVSPRSGGRRGRNFPVTVDITDSDGNVIHSVRLVARLKTIACAAVAVRKVSRGDTVTADDIELRAVDVTAYDDYYSDVEPVVGKAAKRYLRADTVLRTKHLRDPYVVKRGDRVTVEIRDNDFMVQAVGTARDNGCKGDDINVLIDMTKTVISCQIEDADTVIAGGRS